MPISRQADKFHVHEDPERDPTMFKIMRWLIADKSRTLPSPHDDAGIQELAQAVGKSPEYIRKLMAWNLDDRPDDYTPMVLT
jgi:hypothetical protein